MKVITKIVAVTICSGAVFGAATPSSADIASVRYVHKYVTQVWDITVPHTSADSNLISMKYLMQVVDKANEVLNGAPTTDYANDSTRATSNIASIAAVKNAVDNLIKKEETDRCPENTFCFVPETSDTSFMFYIYAVGNYTIDWGDGTVDTINKTTTSFQEISHTYADSANTHEVKLTGKATAYRSDGYNSTIMFDGEFHDTVSKISGCLGCIFPTLSDGSQPNFTAAFFANTKLSSIPEHLFDGVTGIPGKKMFYQTFSFCESLESIPQNLFVGLTPTDEYADEAFKYTFERCYSLTGYSPKIGGKYLYEIWTPKINQYTFEQDKELSDYDCIPKVWGGGDTKNPGECGAE